MSQLFNNVIQPIRTSIFTQQKRFRGKINIQRPKPPHHERGKVEKMTIPFISNPDTIKPLWERCSLTTMKPKEEKTIHPYTAILARECLSWFKNSNMVGLFHTNPISAPQKFEFAVSLKRANMYLKGYQPSVLDAALKDTHYEPILHLLQRGMGENLFVFSPETNSNKLFQISKKTPQVILLGGIVHGKLLSRKELLEYGKLDLLTARAGLVQLLRSASGGNVNQQLTHHQSTLVTRLKQIGTKEENKPCDVNE